MMIATLRFQVNGSFVDVGSLDTHFGYDRLG